MQSATRAFITSPTQKRKKESERKRDEESKRERERVKERESKRELESHNIESNIVCRQLI